MPVYDTIKGCHGFSDIGQVPPVITDESSHKAIVEFDAAYYAVPEKTKVKYQRRTS